MAERTVTCAKLGKELPALDETTPDGRSALKMAQLLGGPEMKQRVHDHVSAQAWQMWKDHMRMVINEYRLDPTSDDANPVLAQAMEQFLFGPGGEVPGYTPPQ
jgi:Fe-S cluster biosynthesis and repair protein YggX